MPPELPAITPTWLLPLTIAFSIPKSNIRAEPPVTPNSPTLLVPAALIERFEITCPLP